MWARRDKLRGGPYRWRSFLSIREADPAPQLGEGIYTYSEAARILSRVAEPVTRRRVYYWIKTGLTPPSVHGQGMDALSFQDLISLEMVRRLRLAGLSLQRIRLLEVKLRQLHAQDRPMAYEVFFTDGATVWARETGEVDPKLIEVVGRKPGHYTWGPVVRTFAKEIRFDGPERRAVSWNPHPAVEINPVVQFGAPVVAGTRIPIGTIGANLEVGGPAEVAAWYDLTVDQVLGVRDYLALAQV